MLKAIGYGLRTQAKQFSPYNVQKRNFWEFVNMMFNKPDAERIRKLGPDRACAEWVLRNGGKVVWDGGKKLSDYNSLPPEDHAVPKIVEIDGTDSGISHYGFPHLVGCSNIRKIVLHNASYVDDRALKGLAHAKDTLNHLQVSKCSQVTDTGIKDLKELTNLQTLVLFGLPSVDNLEDCSQYLKSHLSKCNILGAENEVNEVKVK